MRCGGILNWSGRQDLNLRPLDPQSYVPMQEERHSYLLEEKLVFT